MYKILVVDDEKKIRETLRDYLEAKGFLVALSADGENAVEQCADGVFDLIILDVMMPVMDGIEACKEIRRFSETPILFLSALGREEDMLKAFGVGADDYIIKPFPLSVLEQKCRTMIRRNKGLAAEDYIQVSGIRLDYGTREVSLEFTEGTVPLENGPVVKLAGKDFELLAFLMENKNRVLDRELILSKVWGYGFEGENRVVDTHVKNIRKALGEKGRLIETVVGSGYMFREEL